MQGIGNLLLWNTVKFVVGSSSSEEEPSSSDFGNSGLEKIVVEELAVVLVVVVVVVGGAETVVVVAGKEMIGMAVTEREVEACSDELKEDSGVEIERNLDAL